MMTIARRSSRYLYNAKVALVCCTPDRVPTVKLSVAQAHINYSASFATTFAGIKKSKKGDSSFYGSMVTEGSATAASIAGSIAGSSFPSNNF